MHVAHQSYDVEHVIDQGLPVAAGAVHVGEA